MFPEMQQAVPKAPTTPPPPATTVPRTDVPATSSPLDLAAKSYDQLRAMYNELSSQRQNLANRRDALGATINGTTGANRAGIESRLSVLDANIVTLETEMQVVGQRMAQIRGSGTLANPRDNGRTNPGVVIGTGFLTFIVTMVLIVPFAVRRAKASWIRSGGSMTTPLPVAGNDRLDRIEQAVDAIAIEIERVSENQRFMTRLMTETQLAGTIAAVRSSTEMAKSVAESESK